ncbi:hypothetical protein M9H77_24535 [Catharanthus roseus]|uniref:Uncharacterized protein n=1 Tax=Catharanthus roseus TaxID=4058 RepID=A0ACC0AXM8_CATRO|nr:hypothetical protein M9H77_24535 [Catharanthus roseus]
MEELYGLTRAASSKNNSELGHNNYDLGDDLKELLVVEHEDFGFRSPTWLPSSAAAAGEEELASAHHIPAAANINICSSSSCNNSKMEKIMSNTASASAAAAAGSSSSSSSSCSSEQADQEEMKEKISCHPLYPKLLHSHIHCHKVGAPPEIANLLDQILKENDVARNTTVSDHCFPGAAQDPELDEFMENYCNVLNNYKLELERPFNEATTFLNNIESQLTNLMICNNSNTTTLGDEDGVSSYNDEDDDTSSGGTEILMQQYNIKKSENSEIKEKIMSKYSGYIKSLRHEFSKTKKKGKLPSHAKQLLQHWWTIHHNWPYPTEADKVGLVESTGLDQKQINNWFINQRKRHWKPSDHHFKSIVLNNLYDSFFPD